LWDDRDRTRGLLWGGDPSCRQVREDTSAEASRHPLRRFPGTFTGHRVRVRIWILDFKVWSIVSFEYGCHNGGIRKALSLRLGAAVQQEAQAGCPGYRGPALETDSKRDSKRERGRGARESFLRNFPKGSLERGESLIRNLQRWI
jgi:hypothetical protein